MKKIFLCTLLLLFCLISFGQNHFLNSTLENVYGRNVKVTQIQDESKDFYTSSSFEKENRIQHSTLIDKIYTVDYSYGYKSSKGDDKQVVVLISENNMPNKIYYDYNPYTYLSLPFKFVSKIGKELNSSEMLCNDIETTTDKYTGEKKISSPDLNDIAFIKYIVKGKLSQYVSVYIYGSTVVINEKGLIILFKSGKKIVRPNELIKTDVSSYSNKPYSYHAFFTPTLNEIQLLKNDEIIGVKLYIFDTEISEGEKLKQFANCVLNTPKIKKK